MDGYWNLVFTQLSFTLLALGSLVLSAITRSVGGNRTWAVILSLTSIGVSLAMFFTYDASGILPAAVGFVALLIAVLPKRKN
ncbi:MAG: hypothetical protein ACKOWE_01455 [Micrococcales bacterium]